jgi:hypothetical protein
MSVKKTEKAIKGNLNTRTLTNEEEVQQFTGRIHELELSFLDQQGKTQAVTNKNLNTWLDDMEQSFGAGMVRNNTMAGYGGYGITHRSAQLGFDFEDFKEAYRNQVVRLSQTDLTQARLLRNNLGLSLQDTEAVNNLYNEYDDFIKQSFGKPLDQIKNEFVKKGVYRDMVFFIDSGGRLWNPSAYAEMYARTRSREIEDIIMTDEMREVGLDVVQINNVSTVTPICLQYEGKFFSKFGQTPELPVLEIFPSFHPNCRHRMIPQREFTQRMETVNKKVNKKVSGLRRTWSKAEKKYIKNQESWNLENRN